MSDTSRKPSVKRSRANAKLDSNNDNARPHSLPRRSEHDKKTLKKKASQKKKVSVTNKNSLKKKKRGKRSDSGSDSNDSSSDSDSDSDDPRASSAPFREKKVKKSTKKKSDRRKRESDEDSSDEFVSESEDLPGFNWRLLTQHDKLLDVVERDSHVPLMSEFCYVYPPPPFVSGDPHVSLQYAKQKNPELRVTARDTRAYKRTVVHVNSLTLHYVQRIFVDFKNEINDHVKHTKTTQERVRNWLNFLLEKHKRFDAQIKKIVRNFTADIDKHMKTDEIIHAGSSINKNELPLWRAFLVILLPSYFALVSTNKEDEQEFIEVMNFMEPKFKWTPTPPGTLVEHVANMHVMVIKFHSTTKERWATLRDDNFLLIKQVQKQRDKAKETLSTEATQKGRALLAELSQTNMPISPNTKNRKLDEMARYRVITSLLPNYDSKLSQARNKSLPVSARQNLALDVVDMQIRPSERNEYRQFELDGELKQQNAMRLGRLGYKMALTTYAQLKKDKEKAVASKSSANNVQRLQESINKVSRELEWWDRAAKHHTNRMWMDINNRKTIQQKLDENKQEIFKQKTPKD